MSKSDNINLHIITNLHYLLFKYLMINRNFRLIS